jgi:D-serine deaminase-like pyridoxal phosphate-dependent protein
MISFLDKTWTDVYKPTLILRAEVAKANIAWMADKANKAGVRFRPHFKTHQSAHVGQWYKEAGVTAITVSSVTMVQYFARAGWNDITIAFPVNIREVAAINELASKVSLNLVVESLETVSFLAKALTHAVKVWIKTDTGYKRTGIDWQNIRGVVDLAKSIKQHDTLHFAGLLAHAGHSYKEYTLDRILDIHQQTLSRLQELKSELEQAHFNDCELSLGDTPSCSLADDFTGVNEILFSTTCNNSPSALVTRKTWPSRWLAQWLLSTQSGAQSLSMVGRFTSRKTLLKQMVRKSTVWL